MIDILGNTTRHLSDQNNKASRQKFMKTIINLDFNKVEEFSVVLFSLEYKVLSDRRMFIITA